MSRGFVKDGDQEEVPVVPPRAFLPKGMTNYVTEQGMAALQKEKEALLEERNALVDGTVELAKPTMTKVADTSTRADVDLQTSNESDRRIRRNYLNARLELLQQRIRTAVIMDPAKQTEGIVGFGAYVTYQMGESEVRRTIHITGADEADVVKGYISYFSPLARALTGRKEGEYVKVPLPTGPKVVIIISVTFKAPKNEDGGGLQVPESQTSPKQPSQISKELSGDAENERVTDTHPAIPDIKEESPINNNPPQESPTKETPPKEGPPKDPKPMKDNANEVFPIVNERGITIGRALRWQCHDGSKLLHPVVHLHVFNTAGDLYLQRRPQWKDIQPGKWDTAVGGHVGFGEQIETALRRETKEELGITDFTPTFIKRYVFESPREKELVHAYKTIYEAEITPSNELDGGRFWSREEIISSLGKKIFTPNFEQEYKTLFK